MDEIFEIRLGDPKYPKLLVGLSGAPRVLFCRGNMELLNTKSMAIVGTRQPTLVGNVLVRRQYDQIDKGVTIVSGLALGIDALAHETAIEQNMKTIAVLPIGVTDDSIVPLENRDLARQILGNGGLLISPYKEGEPKDVKSKYYLERNLVIAGLSEKIVGLEAKPRSGTLYTLEAAKKYNREVWVNYRGRNETLSYTNESVKGLNLI